MRFTLNWRFLLKLTIVLIIAGVAIHFTHRWQAKQQAGIFLNLANAARDADPPETTREIRYLKRYVQARPRELDVRERLARQMCNNAKTGNDTQEAILVLEDTLRRDPGRDELRLFAVEYYMKSGFATEALDSIEILLAKQPNNGELESKKALCLVYTGKFEEAVEWFQKALEHRPDLVESYPTWATVLRTKLKKNDEADQVVVQMLEANPQNFRAHLLVAKYWRSFFGLGANAQASAKAVAEAQKLATDDNVLTAISRAVSEAEKLAPGDLDVLLAVANTARLRSYELARAATELARTAKNERQKAESAEKREAANAEFALSYQILKETLEKYPTEERIYLELAEREAELKQEKEPVEVIRDGLALIPNSVRLKYALLDYQISAENVAGAEQALEMLKADGLSDVLREYQIGRILTLKGEWLKATHKLEYVRINAPNNETLQRKVNFFLARCYQQMGVNDKRLEALKRAIPDAVTDRLWLITMLGIADAEEAMGRIDEALQTYNKIKDQGRGSAWIPIARIQMTKALQTPAEKRDWKATEEALSEAERIFPENTEVRLIRADLLHFTGNSTEARKRLEALRLDKPKDPAVWIALVIQDLRDGNLNQALTTLAAADTELGDLAELRLARARLMIEAKESDLEQKIEELTKNTDKFTLEQRRLLVRGLAELTTTTVPGPLNTRLWEQVSALQPYDLGVHLLRFDLALIANDEAGIKAMLQKIREIDGESGSTARLARVMVLIRAAQRSPDQSVLDEAQKLLTGLERERPTWARVAYAQAVIHELKGNERSALESYRKAVNYGEQNPDAIRRLVVLLRRYDHLLEADRVMNLLPKKSMEDRELQRIAAEVALENNNFSKAEAYADQAVPVDSKNSEDFLWQGVIYFDAGAKIKAEAAFRKAVSLKPEAPEGWLLLLVMLTQSGQIPEGEKLVEEAKDKVAVEERSLFLAKSYSLLRKDAKAIEAFKQALTERPTHLLTIQSEANFHFSRGNKDEAIAAFKRIIDHSQATPEEKALARRMVITLVSNEADDTVRRVLGELGLLEGDRIRQPKENETPAERRTRITALAVRRDRDSRLEAIRLLEAEPNIQPNDQFLLANLYLSVGDRARVRLVMTNLLRKNDHVSLYVSSFASWLLQIGDHRAAEKWVKKLTELQPDAISTAILRARLAAAQGDKLAARKIIVSIADQPNAPLQTLARVCEAIELNDVAESLYKRVVEKIKMEQPQAPLMLAAYYGRQRNTTEALRICDEMRHVARLTLVGRIAVEALYDAPTLKPTDAESVAAWLDEGIKKADDKTKAALIQLLASVRNLQGDYEAAATLYRNAIETNPRDVLALNNLAFLISAKNGNHDEALKVIKTAIGIAGSLPELRDTEAIIRLNAGDWESARKLLEGVVAEVPSGTGYFHLTQAELAGGRLEEARRAWKQAVELGVKETELHPLERPAFRRVQAGMR